MITKVTYARLFNLGNYENEQIEVEVSVENGEYAAAFALAREAVEAQHKQFQADREAQERREYEERQAEYARRRAEQQAEMQRARNAGGDEVPF